MIMMLYIWIFCKHIFFCKHWILISKLQNIPYLVLLFCLKFNCYRQIYNGKFLFFLGVGGQVGVTTCCAQGFFLVLCSGINPCQFKTIWDGGKWIMVCHMQGKALSTVLSLLPYSDTFLIGNYFYRLRFQFINMPKEKNLKISEHWDRIMSGPRRE